MAEGFHDHIWSTVTRQEHRRDPGVSRANLQSACSLTLERTAEPIAAGWPRPVSRPAGIPPGCAAVSGAEHGMECCNPPSDPDRMADYPPPLYRRASAGPPAQGRQGCDRDGWRERFARVL